MKITDVRLRRCAAELPAPMRSRGDVGYREYFHTGSERQRLDVVELVTEAGPAGLTLLGGGWGELPAFLEQVARPVLVGAGPGGIPRLVASLRARAAAGSEGPPRAAAVAVNRLEFALWDLAAKAAGLPLARFLGAPDLAPVQVYAGGGSLCWNPLPALAAEAAALAARGFRAMKIKIGHGPEADAAVVRAVRAAVGPDIRLMVDANCSYDLAGALALAPVLDEMGVYWFEEPFPYGDPAPWRQLGQATRAKIAGGEGFARLMQAAEALREGRLAILQCDAGGFGLGALLAAATLAAEASASLTPHSCNSVLGFVVASHLQLAIATPEIQEFETFDNPFVHSIFNERFTLRDGALQLPPGPGVGYTLNEETVERYRVG